MQNGEMPESTMILKPTYRRFGKYILENGCCQGPTINNQLNIRDIFTYV